VLFTGIGPLLAWRRISWASARRVFVAPAIVGAVAALALGLFTDAGESPWALVLFAFAAFALTGLAQEFWRGARARQSLRGGSLPAALAGIVARNRRRYGGYVVHAGVAVLLVGVAASSSFQTKQDVRLRPGQSATVGGYRVTYVRPTARVDGLAFTAGAVERVEKDGRAFTLHPTRRFYRPTGTAGGGTIASYFAGESDSHIGLRAGARRDFWTAIQPTISGVQGDAKAADAGFKACVGGAPGTPPQCRDVARLMRAAAASPRLRPLALRQIEALQLATAKRIARGYLAEAAPATLRVIVDPLATWIWIGGLIALGGALIAIWPSRGARRRPAPDSELEALKEAKYREIRDAELDHAAGKLSDEDFALLDAELRAEAVSILDGAGANGDGSAAPGGGDPDREPESQPVEPV